MLDDLLATLFVAIEAELKAVNPQTAQAEPRQQYKRTQPLKQFPCPQYITTGKRSMRLRLPD
ncbi:hypothetical protein K5E40_32585 [Pseudomonas baetica]|nr:hypothetical protein [Pseudomonas baetica]